MALPEFFNKKLGPLPVWAWTGVGGGMAAIGYYIYKKRQAAKAASATSATSQTGLTTGQYNSLESQIAGLYGANANQAYGPSGGGYYYGGTGYTTGTGTITSTGNGTGSGNTGTGTGTTTAGSVTVPNVVGLSVGASADAINGAGLREIYDAQTIAIGANNTSTVTGQNPSAGTSVPANSIVTISATVPAGTNSSGGSSNTTTNNPNMNQTLQQAVNNTPAANSPVVQSTLSGNQGLAYGGYTARTSNGVVSQGYGYYYPGTTNGVTYTANNSNTPQSLSAGV